jgi:hypothetical protein
VHLEGGELACCIFGVDKKIHTKSTKKYSQKKPKPQNNNGPSRAFRRVRFALGAVSSSMGLATSARLRWGGAGGAVGGSGDGVGKRAADVDMPLQSKN